MKIETAKIIFESSQQCIKILNKTLVDIQDEFEQDEFREIRTSFALAMGQLIEICELHVYQSFPGLRPYSLDDEDQ